MKLVYVIDTVSDIKNKLDLLKSKFGNEIYYVVKSPFQSLVKSFGYNINALYTKNLAKVIHNMLLSCPVDDIVICYNSLDFNNQLLNSFIGKIGNGKKIVNLMPNYNFFEQIGNGTYNIYVKSMFKNKDSLASTKLQYIPREFLLELLSTHFANKMFEINPLYVTNVYIEDKEINKSAKTKRPFNKFSLIPIIVALLVAAAAITVMAFVKIGYLFWLVVVFALLLDIVLAIIFDCKSKFDARFLN